MYYRRQGEPTQTATMEPYYKEDFTLLDPAMTDTNRYLVYALMAAILVLVLWLLWGKYGKKLRKSSASMFY